MRPDTDEPVLLLAWDFQSAYVHELANAFARTGSKVILLGADSNSAPPYEPGVEFHNLRGSSSPRRTAAVKARELLRSFARALRFIRRSGIRQVYQVGTGKPFLHDLGLNLLLKLGGVRVIHTVHNILPHGRDTALYRLVYRLVYRSIADALVVHAENIVERLVRDFGVPAEKITQVPHGVYRPAEDPRVTRESARRALGLPPGAGVVLAFGQQYPYKGTHLLLQALAAERPPAGGGASEGAAGVRVLVRGTASPAYARRLQQIVEEGGLEGRVDLAFGYVSDAQMELLFKACDLVALPYLEGSQSGVLYMAYAFGRPVLASDIGCFPRHVLPGRTGEVFRAGEVRELGAALERMLAGRDGYSESFIREHARREYSWEASVETIRRRVLDRAPAGGNKTGRHA